MYRVVNYKKGITPFETRAKANEFQAKYGGKIYIRVASCIYNPHQV